MGGKRKGLLCLLMQPDFKKGDKPPAPHDYLGWQEWARIQYRHGLRQHLCEHRKWVFPQEGCERHLALEASREQGKMDS